LSDSIFEQFLHWASGAKSSWSIAHWVSTLYVRYMYSIKNFVVV
jgi:hypothetical protein